MTGGDVAAALARVVAGVLGAVLLVPAAGAVLAGPSSDSDWTIVAVFGVVAGLPGLLLLGLASIDVDRGLSSGRGIVTRCLAALTAVGFVGFLVAGLDTGGSATDRDSLGFLAVVAALLTVVADQPWRHLRRPRVQSSADDPRPRR